jgi:Domain of unknown function (DUF1905)/Bacteriocin-protection, YdeI or OmpD-Associated
MQSFSAKIFKIGINPHVFVPAAVLKALFKEAGKDKGHIPIKGTINGHPFTQTLVKYSGKWRLYLNTPMRKGSASDVGDTVKMEIEFDPADRTVPMHLKLQSALEKSKKANAIFLQLPPSRQKEICRYINHLKSDESVEKNIKKVINFLLGKERFIGRDQP